MAIAAKQPKQDVVIEEAEVVSEPKKGKGPKAKATKAEAKKSYTAADVQELQKNYAELQMKVVTGNEKNTAELRKMRKEIARALTYLNTNK